MSFDSKFSSQLVLATVLSWSTLIITVSAPHLHAQTDVLTNRNDNNRTGSNLNESDLTTANVNRSQFGHLFHYNVEGNIFGQPLVVTRVYTKGGVRNVVYVVTSNDVLYAFDADGRSVRGDGGLIWNDCFTSQPLGGDPVQTNPCPQSSTASFIQPNDPVYDGVFLGSIGIIGTPVIDRARGALYLVTRMKLSSGEYVQSLHAIDITNGKERTSPREIARGVINGPGSSTASFSAVQNQRAGLGLVGNRIVVAWGGGTNEGANVASSPARYRGYVIAFDADNLAATGCFSAMGEGGADLGSNGTHGAAIWQSGRAPVIDQDGYVYFQTGNTLPGPDLTPDPCKPLGRPWRFQQGISNSLIKLDVSNDVTIVDHTAPERYRQALDDCDLDLSGSGPLLIPGTSALIGGGKQGFLHVFEKRAGKYIEKSSRQVYDGPIEQYSYQSGRCVTLSANPSCVGRPQGCHHIMSGPVYWESASRGKLIYVSAENDAIKAFRFESSGQVLLPYDDDLLIPTGNLPLVMRTRETVFGHPGANLSISANGYRVGTGILWAVNADVHEVTGHEFYRQPMPGILHAYDAENLSHELWNSQECPDDNLGMFPKFTPPTIANGKVYVASFSGKLMVYGLRQKPLNCR